MVEPGGTAETLADLTDEEALAFAALVRALVRSDGEVTELEREVLADIAVEFGEDRFWDWMERAGEQIEGREAIEAAARKVESMSARELIFAALGDLAMADSIGQAEAEVLDWLAERRLTGARCGLGPLSSRAVA
jgi:hypothetical protein